MGANRRVEEFLPGGGGKASCREHGVWLDNGELEAMINNLRLDPLFLGKIATRLWELRF